MKRQFWLISFCVLVALTSCNRKPKDGFTDTYTSGVISIAADESFQPIVQEEIDVSLVILLRLMLSIFF